MRGQAGQQVGEYAILLGVVMTAFLGAQMWVTRSVAGGLVGTSNAVLGPPDLEEATVNTTSDSTVSEQADALTIATNVTSRTNGSNASGFTLVSGTIDAAPHVLDLSGMALPASLPSVPLTFAGVQLENRDGDGYAEVIAHDSNGDQIPDEMVLTDSGEVKKVSLETFPFDPADPSPGQGASHGKYEVHKLENGEVVEVDSPSFQVVKRQDGSLLIINKDSMILTNAQGQQIIGRPVLDSDGNLLGFDVTPSDEEPQSPNELQMFLGGLAMDGVKALNQIPGVNIDPPGGDPNDPSTIDAYVRAWSPDGSVAVLEWSSGSPEMAVAPDPTEGPVMKAPPKDYHGLQVVKQDAQVTVVPAGEADEVLAEFESPSAPSVNSTLMDPNPKNPNEVKTVRTVGSLRGASTYQDVIGYLHTAGVAGVATTASQEAKNDPTGGGTGIGTLPHIPFGFEGDAPETIRGYFVDSSGQGKYDAALIPTSSSGFAAGENPDEHNSTAIKLTDGFVPAGQAVAAEPSGPHPGGDDIVSQLMFPPGMATQEVAVASGHSPSWLETMFQIYHSVVSGLGGSPTSYDTSDGQPAPAGAHPSGAGARPAPSITKYESSNNFEGTR